MTRNKTFYNYYSIYCLRSRHMYARTWRARYCHSNVRSYVWMYVFPSVRMSQSELDTRYMHGRTLGRTRCTVFVLGSFERSIPLVWQGREVKMLLCHATLTILFYAEVTFRWKLRCFNIFSRFVKERQNEWNNPNNFNGQLFEQELPAKAVNRTTAYVSDTWRLKIRINRYVFSIARCH